MIRDALGTMKVAEVRPADVDTMLKGIAGRGAPTMANEALLWSKRLFRWAMKRELCSSNPADGFDRADAGGKRDARSRWLSEEEIKRLFELMALPNFGAVNRLAVTLLLALMVRKDELTGARRSEFDLDAGLWRLPADRTKTDTGQIIPMPDLAVDALRSLMQINPSSEWLLPARLWRTEGDQPMGAGTLNIALNKVVRPVFAKEGRAPFVLHDLRRTGRTWLSKLGIDFLVAERCLNHKLPGVSGVYDHDDRLEARKSALATWAGSLVAMGATGAL
jgi:integrase